MSRQSRAPYVFSLLLGLVCWSTVPIFIRYLNDHMGNFTQNLYRYVAACALLWTLTLILFRQHVRFGRHLLPLLGPMAVMCVHQILWVQSIKLTTPTTATLLTQFQVVIVGLLAFVFFPAERRAILSPRFLLGALLALVGVVGFILAGNVELSGTVVGYTIVLLTAGAWASYTVVSKAAIRGIHPVVAFSFVSTGVFVFFLVSTPFFGRPAQVVEVPLGVPVALVVSGVIGIALAHLFYYTALSGLSAAVCGTATLIVPVLTGVWSFIIYKEKLTPLQLLFGLVLLAGAALAVSRRRPSPTIEGPPD